MRTRIRKLKKHLKKSGINYEQIFKSINNLASSKDTLDKYFSQIFKEISIKSRNSIIINFEKFQKLNDDLKIRIVNESIKHVTKNYYNPRSKKVVYLLKKVSSIGKVKATLGGCLIIKESKKLMFKKEKKSIF